MIGWTTVAREELPAGGPMRPGPEVQLPAPNATVAAMLFKIAATAAPLTVERAQRISRLAVDDVEDFLDRLVMEGELIRDDYFDCYLRSGR